MSEPITFRIPRIEADNLGSFGVRTRLEKHGIDTTKPMTCQEEEGDLVYQGSPKKGETE